MPLDAIRTIAGAVPTGAVVFVDEAYAEFAGVSVHPRARRVSRTSSSGRTFSKAFGLAGLRIGCLVGAPATVDPIRRGGAGLQRQHRRRRRRPGGARRISITSNDYLRQVAESKALLYAACDRLGLKYWKSDANFVLVCAGDRTDALVKGAFATRHLHARPLDRARLRRLPPHRHRHRRAHAPLPSRRWKRSCAPRGNRPPDDGNADRAARSALDGKGTYQRAHRHPLSRSHAGARRAPRRLRPPDRRRRRPRRRSASHRRGSRHRARRGGVEGARRRGAASTAPATS